MKPTLITGGAGFVGRSLTHELLSRGREEVVIVDNLASGQDPQEWLPDDFEHYTDNHRNSDKFSDGEAIVEFYNEDARDFFRRTERDYGDVFHLAAIIGGRESIDGEPLKVASDLSLDAQFFNWAVDSEPERILYASSSAAYPTELQNPAEGQSLLKAEYHSSVRPLVEDDISFEGYVGVPDMTYGWSKLTGEYLARFAADHYDLHVACIRPFSGYGEEQSFNYPVPSIAKRAIKQEDPLTIWGSGNQTRDFIHMDDCVEGMLIALDEISDGSGVNLGRGEAVDFWEVAETFADIVGYDPEIKNLPEKPEGVKYRVADTTVMEETLDWEPSIDLEEGFTRVVEAVEERMKVEA